VEEDSGIFYGRLDARGKLEVVPIRSTIDQPLRKSSGSVPAVVPVTRRSDGPPRPILWVSLVVLLALAALVAWRALKG